MVCKVFCNIQTHVLRRNISILWSSFFLSFMCFANYILDILSFWANICFSVCAYHLCSFVIALPHSGWYPPDAYICLRISWIHCFKLLSSTPLCKCTTFSVSTPLLRGIWVEDCFFRYMQTCPQNHANARKLTKSKCLPEQRLAGGLVHTMDLEIATWLGVWGMEVV
jgi:hypothetical protein